MSVVNVSQPLFIIWNLHFAFHECLYFIWCTS